MTFTSFPPKYWLQYWFLKTLYHWFFPVLACMFKFQWRGWMTLASHITTAGMGGTWSPLTSNHWFVFLPLNGIVRPSLHIYIVSTRIFMTAHRAERREMEQRDATAQQETGTNPTHPHTHICTDAPKPPGSPICFLACHSQRCFSALLASDYSPHFWPAGI